MKTKGFTLVEILIALALAGLVMTGVYSVYSVQHKGYVVQEDVAKIQQNLRSALYLMELDFRMAGYDPSGLANSGLEGVEDDRIQFAYVADDDERDNDNDGVTDEDDEETTVIYELFDADGDGDDDLGRAVPDLNGGNNVAVAENIDSISFVYYDALGNEIDVSAGGDPDDIRVIEVTLVAHGYREDPGYTQFADNLRRRTMTKRIRARNLGLDDT